MTAFHECAGSPLRPTLPVRRVANVTWGGVRLGDVLDRAGVEPAAQYLWSYGADHGEYGGVESPCYLKDLPIAETQRELSRAQETLGREQEKMGREQQKLGEQQHQLGKQFEKRLDELIAAAIRNGTAKPLPD